MSQDRDETRDPCLRDRDHQTETFKILFETRLCSFQDVGRNLEATKTFESLGSFKVSPRRCSKRMMKLIEMTEFYMH